MSFSYVKYSATGNTFLAFDNRQKIFNLEAKSLLSGICQRYQVDGLLFVEPPEGPTQFLMRYVNADGGEVEMCGNGGRAISKFAHEELGIELDADQEINFETLWGEYCAKIGQIIKLQMTELKDYGSIDILDLYPSEHAYYLNTGVPHCVFSEEHLDELDLVAKARPIRYEPRFENGTNVNFFKVLAENKIQVRTYERGVEGETLSCGTGVTAVALACFEFFDWHGLIEVQTKGGTLWVEFDEDFQNVFLSGAVEKLEAGTIDL